MNRRTHLSVAASILVAATMLTASAQSKDNVLDAKLEVASAAAKQNAVALTAWKLRDPSLFMSTVPVDFRLPRPDGSVLTWQTLYERTKLQMAAVKHVDRFVLTIEVESVSAENAIVLTTQDWTRVVTGSDGKDARFKTGVTHRETWKRANGQWTMEGFTEHNPTREQLGDASVTDRREHFEIQLKLVDAPIRPANGRGAARDLP